MNAREELIEHVADRDVKYIHIAVGCEWGESRRTIGGTLPEVLPQLDFEYDCGYGGQELFGYIWYTDGTWSERGEYDGSEWWDFKSCPPLPDNADICRERSESVACDGYHSPASGEPPVSDDAHSNHGQEELL